MLNGMRIIESRDLVEDGPARTAWRPCGGGWAVKYTYVPKVPYRGAVQLNATTLVMHPDMLRYVRDLQREQLVGEQP